MVNEAMQWMTIEATSKENYYSKRSDNYFQSKHMGTTNKLVQKALQKRMHSSRQPEAAIFTIIQWVKMGWEPIDPAIITKSFKNCSISNALDGWTAWQIRHRRRRLDVWWHMNKYNRCLVKRVMMIINIGDNLLILARLICGFDSRRLTGPRNRCVLYAGATYMRIYMVVDVTNFHINSSEVYPMFGQCIAKCHVTYPYTLRG